MAEDAIYRALVSIGLVDENTIGRLDAILGQVEGRLASLNIKAPIGTGVFAGLETGASATVAAVERVKVAIAELQATKSVTGAGALSGPALKETEALIAITQQLKVTLGEVAISQQNAGLQAVKTAAETDKETAALQRLTAASERAAAAPRIGGRFASAAQIAALPAASAPVTNLGYGPVPVASGANQLAGVGQSERRIALTAQLEKEERALLAKTTAMTAAGSTALQIEEATTVERLRVRGATALIAEEKAREAAAIAKLAAQAEAAAAAGSPQLRALMGGPHGQTVEGRIGAERSGAVIGGAGLITPDTSNMSLLRAAEHRAVRAAIVLEQALQLNSEAVLKDTAAVEGARAGYIQANVALQRAIEKEAVAHTNVFAVVTADASARVQTLQTDLAIAKTMLLISSEAAKGAVTEVQIQQARNKVLTIQERLIAVYTKEAAEAAGGSGGRGMGIGSALKYFAFYQLFTLAEHAIRGMVTNTEEYSLGLNQLAIVMKQTPAQVEPLAQKYAGVGLNLATPPAVAVNAGVAYKRFFQDPEGESGDIGARLGSTIALLEARHAKDGEEETLVRKRLDEMGAIAKNWDTGAAGAEGVYGMATEIAHHYGQRMGGSLTGGTAQIADLFKQSGFTAAQSLSMVGAVTQYSGTTSEAAAGDLKRLLGRAGSGTFTSLFGEYGIGSGGNMLEKLTQLSSRFKDLPVDGTEREHIITTLGGGRSGSAALNMIQTLDEVLKTAKEADSTTGKNAANKEGQDKLATFAGQMEQLTTDFNNLALDMGKSGLGGALGLILKTIDPVVRGLDQVMKFFAGMPQGVSPVIGALGAFALAIKLFGGQVKVAEALTKFGAGGGAANASKKAVTAENTAALTANVEAMKMQTKALLDQAEAARVATAAAEGQATATAGAATAAGADTAAQGALGVVEGAAVVPAVLDAQAQRNLAVSEALGITAAQADAIAQRQLAASQGVGGLAAARGALSAFAGGIRNFSIAAGSAMARLAPWIALYAGVVIYGDANKQIDVAKEGRDQAVGAGKLLAKADAHAATNPTEAISDYEGAIAAAKEAQTKTDKVTDGLAGGIMKFSQDYASGSFFQGRSSTDDWMATARHATDRMISDTQAKIDALKVVQAEDAKRHAGKADDFWGKDNSYSTITDGITKMGVDRVAPARSAKILIDLLNHSGQESLSRELNPQEGEKGIQEELKRVIDVAGKRRDPAKTLADLKGLQEVVGLEQLKAARSGDAANIAGADNDADTVNKAYFPLLQSRVNARIAAIKSIDGDTASSRARIIALVKGNLKQVASTGDVSGTEAALAVMNQSQVKQLLGTFAEDKRILKLALDGKLALIKAAVAAAVADATAFTLAGEDHFTRTGQGLPATDHFTRMEAAGHSPADDPRVVAAQAAADKAQVEYNKITTAAKTIKTALPYSDLSDSALKFDKTKSGPTAAEIEEARIAATAVPGDALSAASVNLQVATFKLNQPAKDKVEYWNNLKAFHEAQYAYAQAQATATDAAIGAAEIAGDPISQAAGALQIARNKVNAAVGATERSEAQKGLNDSLYSYAQAQQSAVAAQIAASEVPGDPLSQAAAALRIAQNKLTNAVGSTAYYEALKGVRDAQYAQAQAEMSQANDAAQLTLDLTDPVVTARQKIREAQRLLAFNAGRGADTTKDRLTLKQARSAAEKAEFDQTFSDHQTNFNLQRESLSAYMSYLNAQHRYLTSVNHKTRDQINELNQVDQALKGLADSLQGQFNLGSIKVPSAYEARRAVAAGAGATTNTVHININGADVAMVKGILAQYVGQHAMAAAGTQVRKV